MKRILLVSLFVLAALPAVAAVDVTFTNGSETSWETYYVKGTDYCTRLVFGEICYPKTDVVSITKSKHADADGEVGFSVAGTNDRGDLSDVLARSEAADKAFVSKRDAEIDGRARSEAKRVKNNREHGKADWAR